MDPIFARDTTITNSGDGAGIPPTKGLAPVELFTTGIVGPDDILKGGLARNHIYLIEGDPGTGKTTKPLSI